MARAKIACLGLGLAILCSLMMGCTHAPPPLPGASAGPYRLDTGDVVRVIVYNQHAIPCSGVSHRASPAPGGTRGVGECCKSSNQLSETVSYGIAPLSPHAET